MSPYFNTESGEMTGGDDLYTDVADHVTEPDRQQEADRTRREAIGTGKPPAEPEPPAPPEGHRDTAQFGREEAERIRVAALADPTHPLNDPRHPAHEATLEKYLRLGMMADGRDYDDPKDNEVRGELFEGGRIRPRDAAAEAAALATLPAAPEGSAWDPTAHAAVVALAQETPLVRDAMEAVYPAVAEAQARASRGEVMDDLTWERPLVEHWGPDHDQHVENAAYALEVLAASDDPGLQKAAEWLGALWSWDARVVIALAEKAYPALRDGNPGPRVAAMLLRHGERWAQGQAAAKERAAKADETPPDHVVSSGGRP